MGNGCARRMEGIASWRSSGRCGVGRRGGGGEWKSSGGGLVEKDSGKEYTTAGCMEARTGEKERVRVRVFSQADGMTEFYRRLYESRSFLRSDG